MRINITQHRIARGPEHEKSAMAMTGLPAEIATAVFERGNQKAAGQSALRGTPRAPSRVERGTMGGRMR